MFNSLSFANHSMRGARIAVFGLLLSLVVMISSAWAQPARAQEVKVGFVNQDRVIREAVIFQQLNQRLQTEFERRERELNEMGSRLRTQVERFEKEAAVLPESERNRRQREIGELDRDLQRKQREFREDLNQRRNEEFSQAQERVQRAIRQVAEAEKYDLILLDAIYFSQRVDVTEKIIRALNAAR